MSDFQWTVFTGEVKEIDHFTHKRHLTSIHCYRESEKHTHQLWQGPQ